MLKYKKTDSYVKEKEMREKTLFKIGEISKLYNIGLDSIRYYEKVGILHPKRNPDNNYRLYTLDDIRKLTMIRELMDLNMSLGQIKDFDDHLTVDNSLQLLNNELDTINASIEKFVQTKKSIESRIFSIREATKLRQYFYKFRLLDVPQRQCIMISKDNVPNEYVDYAIADYMRAHPQQINTIGACDCYTLDIEHSNPESPQLRTKNVFFYSPDPIYDSNYILPAGKYLSVTYPGDYDETKKWVEKAIEYAKEHHLKFIGDPVEFCHINEYETSRGDEFVLEVQIPVQES